ncbi:ABC transporter ATP-binding protein [Olsenella profusa]|uniref:ABC transporter ATP-binding protein n=1 Tax=Olsenella profusa TaxID=138595 RepID=A0ABS2F4C0_9ACTN|nr:ABC transporter ATP-binding protein [Olsenella profusa]MBM6775622.1 ABC transporter ATP-binding protein [Olsenella profusa]
MSFEVSHLCFAYGERPVLEDVSLRVPDGSLACVLGPNGTGKTTLFRCLLGLERPSSGTVLVNGRDVAALSPAERAREMAFVPQSHAQAFDYSALDVVLMSAAAHLGVLRAPGQRDRRRAREALARVGVAELADRGFSQLSGGERQLVLIARAIAQDARSVVMDEPTSSLDFGNTARVMAQVRSLADEGLSVVVSTHAPDLAYLFSDTVLALDGGRVRASGAPQEVVTAELLSGLYGLEVGVTSLYDDRARACVPVGELRRKAGGDGHAPGREEQ